MIGILLHFALIVLVNALAFYVLGTYIFPESILIKPDVYTTYLILGALFALIHSIIYPILYWITLPVRWLTMGLFGILLHGIVLYILPSFLDILGFTATIEFSSLFIILIIGVILALLNTLFHFIWD